MNQLLHLTTIQLKILLTTMNGLISNHLTVITNIHINIINITYNINIKTIYKKFILIIFHYFKIIIYIYIFHLSIYIHFHFLHKYKYIFLIKDNTSSNNNNDDFADFQSFQGAPSTTTTAAAP